MYDYVDREPFGIIRFQYRSLGQSLKALREFLLTIRKAALKALRVISDEEPDQETETQRQAEPSTGMSGSRLPWSSKPTRKKVRTMKLETRMRDLKQEEEVQGGVKRERSAAEDDYASSEEISIVETRRCKRRPTEREVIVLD